MGPEITTPSDKITTCAKQAKKTNCKNTGM